MTYCTCPLSEAPYTYDAVAHYADCALMAELEGLASGDLLYPGDLSTAALEGQWVANGPDAIRWIPGVDG